MKVLGGILLGILIIILAAIVVTASGSYNVAALNSAGRFEKNFATFTLNRSIARRAPKAKIPFAVSPEALRDGLGHYKENCVTCHGAPGVEESEAAMGLNPPAPDLTLPSIQGMSDGELFWVVSNGIRMTGMPAFSLTHKPDEIWKIVAFVRHMPEITADEQKVLKQAFQEAEHHHGEAPAGEKQEEGLSHEEKEPGNQPEKASPPTQAPKS